MLAVRDKSSFHSFFDSSSYNAMLKHWSTSVLLVPLSLSMGGRDIKDHLHCHIQEAIFCSPLDEKERERERDDIVREDAKMPVGVGLGKERKEGGGHDKSARRWEKNGAPLLGCWEIQTAGSFSLSSAAPDINDES